MHPENPVHRYRIQYKFRVIKENVFLMGSTIHNGEFDQHSDSGKMWLTLRAAEGYKFTNQYTDYNMAKYEIEQPIMISIEKI